MNNIIKVESVILPTRRQLHKQLDSLSMPSDAKVAIAELIDMTAAAGDRVIEIGRRVVAFAFELMRQFPNLTFCTIVALILNTLVAAIPILGPLLQALIGPLVLAGGVALGALLELKDGNLRERIDLLTRQFEALLA